MAALNLETEIKKELREGGAWADQAGNVFYALAWGLGTWISVSTVMVGAAFIALVITGEFDASVAADDLLTFFKEMVFFTYGTGALVVLVFGLPRKLRNVFRDIASDRVERQEKFFKQAELVESVLIRHGLITESEAEQAKADRESN